MSARFWIPLAGVIAATALILFIRNDDDGYRQYYRGEYSTAISGLQKKAESGDSFAAYLLGLIHRGGRVTHNDKSIAQQWFLKSARLGDLNGAVMFARSVVSKNEGMDITKRRDRKICAWYVRVLDMAAKHGSFMAADILGKNYARGECVPQSKLESRYYFSLARAVDRSFGVRLDGKKPLSAADQEILDRRLAIKDTTTTNAQILAYFFSKAEMFE